MVLFPVNWKQSIKRLNDAIKRDASSTRRRTTNEVSDNEYWVFIGLLLLCSVQKSRGVDGLFRNKQTEGMVQG